MLWLLRHADAADADGGPDDQRPLTEKGWAQARAAAGALRHLGAKIDSCLSSPRLRALQTAEPVCEALGLTVQVEPALSGEPIEVQPLVAGLGDVLLVGHDPSFSMLLHDLTGAQARMKKGGLAAINKGELVLLMRPGELAVIAGAAVATG